MAGSVGAGMSILSGANSLFGSPSSGTGMSQQVNLSNVDPWGTSGNRSAAGTMMMNLLQNPAAALSMPGIQGIDKATVNTANANNAAASGGSGAFAPGGAQQTLNNQVQANNMGAFTTMAQIYGGAAGVGNANAETGAAGANASAQNTGLGNVAQGVGALSQSLNGGYSGGGNGVSAPGVLNAVFNPGGGT